MPVVDAREKLNLREVLSRGILQGPQTTNQAGEQNPSSLFGLWRGG